MGVSAAGDAYVVRVSDDPPVGACVSGTKTVSTDFPNDKATYTIVLTNGCNGEQGDNAGDEFSDVLPDKLSVTSVSATSGLVGHSMGHVVWNGSIAPLDSVTVTIQSAIDAGACGTSPSNQGTISYDSDGDGVNDAVATTDDPGEPGGSDATVFDLPLCPICLSATKTVAGDFEEGGGITYEVEISNGCSDEVGDLVGDELSDTLPAELALVGAAAPTGTIATAGNQVEWNGSIEAMGSVTVTIDATVNNGTAGKAVSNQGQVGVDSDSDGTIDAFVLTDDPGQPGPEDPTIFLVGSGPTDLFTLEPCRVIDTRWAVHSRSRLDR